MNDAAGFAFHDLAPGEDRVAKALLARRQIVEGEAGSIIHSQTSSASRSPENAQRAEGGKKLR